MVIIVFFFVFLILIGMVLFGSLYISISHYNFKIHQENLDSRTEKKVKKDFKIGSILIIIALVLFYIITGFLEKL